MLNNISSKSLRLVRWTHNDIADKIDVPTISDNTRHAHGPSVLSGNQGIEGMVEGDAGAIFSYGNKIYACTKVIIFINCYGMI